MYLKERTYHTRLFRGPSKVLGFHARVIRCAVTVENPRAAAERGTTQGRLGGAGLCIGQNTVLLLFCAALGSRLALLCRVFELFICTPCSNQPCCMPSSKHPYLRSVYGCADEKARSCQVGRAGKHHGSRAAAGHPSFILTDLSTNKPLSLSSCLSLSLFVSLFFSLSLSRSFFLSLSLFLDFKPFLRAVQMRQLRCRRVCIAQQCFGFEIDTYTKSILCMV